MKNCDLQTYFLPFHRKLSVRCFWVSHLAPPFHVQPVFSCSSPSEIPVTIFFFHFYYLFTWVFCPVCMSAFSTSAFKGQKKTLDVLGLELQPLWTVIRVLGIEPESWESNQCSWPRSHLLSPRSLYFSLALSTTWWFTKSPSYFAKYDKLASYF